jgi:hypothetical protein
LALYCGVLFLLPAMCVLVGGLLGMLLPPSQARLLSVATASLVVCASPHFQFVTVAGGLCRTVSHSRLCSSYSAQWLIATALQVKSSQVVVRTALPSFPSVMPTQCNSVCGRGRIQLFSLCAVLVLLQYRGRIAGHTTRVSLWAESFCYGLQVLWSPHVVFPTGSKYCLAPVELVLT